MNFETTKHNNSLCSKNSCVPNNVPEALADFSQRPIIFSFRKFTHQNANAGMYQCNMNFCKSMMHIEEQFEMNKNPHSESLPGMLSLKEKSNGIILFPSCRCSLVQKRCAVYHSE